MLANFSYFKIEQYFDLSSLTHRVKFGQEEALEGRKLIQAAKISENEPSRASFRHFHLTRIYRFDFLTFFREKSQNFIFSYCIGQARSSSSFQYYLSTETAYAIYPAGADPIGRREKRLVNQKSRVRIVMTLLIFFSITLLQSRSNLLNNVYDGFKIFNFIFRTKVPKNFLKNRKYFIYIF